MNIFNVSYSYVQVVVCAAAVVVCAAAVVMLVVVIFECLTWSTKYRKIYQLCLRNHRKMSRKYIPTSSGSPWVRISSWNAFINASIRRMNSHNILINAANPPCRLR